MNLTLPLSDTVALIHAPDIGAGKTVGMAKGLFLCDREDIYAGESAGFGAPVWKTGRHTIFPALVAARRLHPDTIEKVYRLDLALTWLMGGIAAPRAFSAAMERIADMYMQRPGQQQRLLNVRRALFGLFHIRSVMVSDRSYGTCRVRYRAEAQRLHVTVDGQALQGRGELILLNEADGLSFTRVRIGSQIREGRNFPAWLTCPFDTVIENPTHALGFSVSRPTEEASSDWRLACGREVTKGLNWAGLALTTNQRRFSYGIHFFL